jgi:type IV pilus assembly protein PilP
MKTFHTMFMSGALALALAGCGEDAPPPPPPRPAPQAQVTATAPAAAPTETPAAVAYVYNYNPVGKRDPFRSPLEDLKPEPGGGVAVGSPCSEPLCQFDIEQLKLVAVVTGDANPMAMVEDPLGRGHVIRRNTKVGRQGGKVTQILRDKVVVTEVITTPERVIQNPVEIKMKADAKLEPAFDLISGKPWEP